VIDIRLQLLNFSAKHHVLLFNLIQLSVQKLFFLYAFEHLGIEILVFGLFHFMKLILKGLNLTKELLVDLRGAELAALVEVV
jgi:hypothetical protein